MTTNKVNARNFENGEDFNKEKGVNSNLLSYNTRDLKCGQF
jgi:hypothetical protein